MGLLPGRPHSFRHQRRPVDDCSPGRGGMAQNGKTRGGAFHGGIGRSLQRKPRPDYGSTVVCPSMTRRTNERIIQSKRARAGSFALVD